MFRHPLSVRFLAAGLVGIGLLLLAVIVFVRACSSVESVPASLESEYIEDTTAPHPIKQRMPVLACSYDLTQLEYEAPIYRYREHNQVTSRFGIDVSSHQPEIDWAAVKEAGVEFVFIRAGFRGYETGKIVLDECFDQHMQGAIDAGLEVGVYFFSQAVTPAEAAEEAALTLSMLEGYDVTYPVVFDWEVIHSDDYVRTQNVSMSNLTDCTIAFCDAVRDAGYTPMYYQNKETTLRKLDLELLTDYGFWLAEYDDLPTHPYHYDIRQYTDRGRIPGIEGRVDLNVCFTPYGEEETP